MEIIKDDDIILNSNEIEVYEEEPKSNHKFVNVLLVIVDFSLAIYFIYNLIVMFTK